jgi:hypothetical protein
MWRCVGGEVPNLGVLNSATLEIEKSDPKIAKKKRQIKNRKRCSEFALGMPSRGVEPRVLHLPLPQKFHGMKAPASGNDGFPGLIHWRLIRTEGRPMTLGCACGADSNWLDSTCACFTANWLGGERTSCKNFNVDGDIVFGLGKKF